MAFSANLGGWIADTLVSRGLSVTKVRKVPNTSKSKSPYCTWNKSCCWWPWLLKTYESTFRVHHFMPFNPVWLLILPFLVPLIEITCRAIRTGIACNYLLTCPDELQSSTLFQSFRIELLMKGIITVKSILSLAAFSLIGFGWLFNKSWTL